MSASLEIILTKDGSHSLYNPDLDETYHSTKGALAESEYVFMEMGIQYLITKQQPTRINVFEVGFGTGLNAFLCARKTSKELSIHFHTVETVPLSSKIFKLFNYTSDMKGLFESLHQCEWEEEVVFEQFALKKMETGLESVELASNFYDVVFFDAFAPSKQPDIWSEANLIKCYDALKAGGILVTYCSQGQFKRNLKSIGFNVEILPGALGKKEMVRAHKI
ncbi:MAG: tRNA (5-methylaminomethyl-2-thiouridine)(34)-methyltransferase MnmD [Cyclobacteriaceae bacterium]